MALDAYLRIVGANQGQITGDVRRPAREGTIAITAYSHRVGTAVEDDRVRPDHSPVVLSKDVDATSPLLAVAYATQEPLTSCELQFVRLSQWGQEEHIYTVDLHDARIREICQELPDTRSPDVVGHRLKERLTVAYTSIEMRWELGASDTVSIPWP